MAPAASRMKRARISRRDQLSTWLERAGSSVAIMRGDKHSSDRAAAPPVSSGRNEISRLGRRQLARIRGCWNRTAHAPALAQMSHPPRSFHAAPPVAQAEDHDRQYKRHDIVEQAK